MHLASDSAQEITYNDTIKTAMLILDISLYVLNCHFTTCSDATAHFYMSVSPHCTCIQLLPPTMFITGINVDQGVG